MSSGSKSPGRPPGSVHDPVPCCPARRPTTDRQVRPLLSKGRRRHALVLWSTTPSGRHRRSWRSAPRRRSSARVVARRAEAWICTRRQLARRVSWSIRHGRLVRTRRGPDAAWRHVSRCRTAWRRERSSRLDRWFGAGTGWLAAFASRWRPLRRIRWRARTRRASIGRASRWSARAPARTQRVPRCSWQRGPPGFLERTGRPSRGRQPTRQAPRRCGSERRSAPGPGACRCRWQGRVVHSFAGFG
jgi:hypothetical protein